MVDNNRGDLVLHLMHTGLSEYEARAYIALLRKSPATAYEMARSAGISTSKIYEVVERMAEKGIFIPVTRGGKQEYLPQAPEEFLDFRRRTIGLTLGEIEKGFAELHGGERASVLRNLFEYEGLVAEASRILDNAREWALSSMWGDEAGVLGARFNAAEGRGVMLSTILFGESGFSQGMVFAHPIQDTLYEEKGGRSIVIVADGAEAIVGTVAPSGAVEAAIGRSRGFVALAEDYIKHDIYMMKVVQRFDPALRERFGMRYEHLRDVFANREAI